MLPVGLAIVAQPDVWAPAPFTFGHRVGPAPVVALLYTVTALALIWRKRYPTAVLAFIVTANAIEYLAFGAPESLGSLLPTVAAFYAVGRYARVGAVSVAAPLALLGIAVHELTDPVFSLNGSDAVFYAVVAAAWPVGRAFQRRAENAHELQAKVADLARQQEKVAEQAATAERAHIARELHDLIGHGLSVTVLQLVGASALLDADRATEARVRLASTELTARQTLAEMRRLLGLLDDIDGTPKAAPQPGMTNLAELVEATRLAGAEVCVEVTGDARPLPPGLDVTAYRVLQESLTNVLKHARPPKCSLHVCYRVDQLVLDVRDAGTATEPIHAGRGLTGMRERVNVFGGTLEAGVMPAGGFAVRACFPLAEG